MSDIDIPSISIDWLMSKTPRRYQPVRVLSCGRKSVVVLAHDQQLGRDVAIKWLPENARTAYSGKRCPLEVKLSLQLRHPNIVTAFDVVRVESLTGIVLSYIAPPKAVGHAASSDERTTIGQVIKLADAIDYLHQKGYAHGDIKPQNALIDAALEVFLCDFGSAIPLDRESDGEIHLDGTPAYLSPERASGESVANVRSDIYSLGVYLIERLSGRPPFEGAPEAILDIVIRQGVPQLKTLGVRASARLQSILSMACHQDPSQRYASASAFGADLRRYLDRRPLLARRRRASENVWLWCRRNRVTASLLLAFLFTLSVGSLFSLMQLRTAAAESRSLGEQERLLEIESVGLLASQRQLAESIFELDQQRIVAESAEREAVSLRTEALRLQKSRTEAVERAMRLESDAKVKQSLLEQTLLKSLAVEQSLSQVKTEVTSVDERVASIQAESIIAKSLDLLTANDWDTAAEMLAPLSEKDRTYASQRIALAAQQKSWNAPAIPIQLPFIPDKFIGTMNLKHLAVASKAGEIVWVDRSNAHDLIIEAVDREVDDATPALMVSAMGMNADGTGFSVVLSHRKQGQTIRSYTVEKGKPIVSGTRPVTGKILAIRYHADKPYAIVTSADQTQVAITGVSNGKVIWRHKVASKSKPQSMILQTNCDPRTTLTFGIYEPHKLSPTEIVLCDFSTGVIKPEVSILSSTAMTIGEPWDGLFFSSNILLARSGFGAVDIDPPSLHSIYATSLNVELNKRGARPRHELFMSVSDLNAEPHGNVRTSRFERLNSSSTWEDGLWPVPGAEQTLALSKMGSDRNAGDARMYFPMWRNTSAHKGTFGVTMTLPVDSQLTTKRGIMAPDVDYFVEAYGNGLVLYQLSAPWSPRYMPMEEFKERLMAEWQPEPGVAAAP